MEGIAIFDLESLIAQILFVVLPIAIGSYIVFKVFNKKNWA